MTRRRRPLQQGAGGALSHRPVQVELGPVGGAHAGLPTVGVACRHAGGPRLGERLVERLVCGLTVRKALERLERRYATACRRLVALTG